MDSLTHIVLGGCIGEALLGKRIGKKAILMGALAQSIPDLDFVASFWMDTTGDLLAHRGITHSLIFIVFLSPVLGELSKLTVMPRLPLLSWTMFFFMEMLVHLFLDAFNNYGVAWFEPFSKLRISFNTIYVADPLISIFPAIAFMILLLTRSKTIYRKKWWVSALLISSCYLIFCINNKLQIDRVARRAFAKQQIPHARYFTTPAPLQSMLWMVVAGDENGFNVGYRSIFDRKSEISFEYFPVNEHLLNSVREEKEVKDLIEFSQGFYTVEQRGDTLVFNDLRFGQIVGWYNPKEKFVFHFYLQQKGNNDLIVQRGRFAKWDAAVFRSFVDRIRGD